MTDRDIGRAEKGSQFWIQEYVNEHQAELNAAIHTAGGPTAADDIEWVSPRKDDGYREYYDAAFLERLGVQLRGRTLNDFWPARGPHWDALGRAPSGDLFLVEAKSHIPEMFSPASQAGASSMEKIRAALDETARAFGASGGCDWTRTFYQYANRLAHLYLLRELNQHEAWLVFLGFTGDTAMDGPETAREWEAAIQVAEHALGLGTSPLRKFVLHAFLPVKSLSPTA